MIQNVIKSLKRFTIELGMMKHINNVDILNPLFRVFEKSNNLN